MRRDTGAVPYGQMGVMNDIYEIDGKFHLDFMYLVVFSQFAIAAIRSAALPANTSSCLSFRKNSESVSSPTVVITHCTHSPRSSNSTAAHGIVPFVRWRLYFPSVTLSNGKSVFSVHSPRRLHGTGGRRNTSTSGRSSGRKIKTKR
jgi:hypothetical protein